MKYYISNKAVVQRICKSFHLLPRALELSTCLPTSSFRGRSRTQRKVVVLRDPDMRMWPVLYHERSGFKVLTSGWEAFSKANNIQPGDGCIFGVESYSESIYGVSIVRK
ncbi:hypothetical protein CICLE_v10023279mg [Citrus x clementina]|uniref:TF-B3 domain-containing protein n=1 Tax=Citrus clementina TaxID=85681 RepID=V4TIS5_CITCL|nr:hypothetical protein CICLE_v10023279mg [Citrus x clementina]